MLRVFRDWLTSELDKYLESKYPRLDVRVIYEKVEDVGEPEPGPSIREIGLPDRLVGILEKRGIERLYKFQYEAYKYILDGNNVVIVAGTGTGKTEAFFIPLAKKIIETSAINPRALLLYPTKALARDQVKRFVDYGVYGKLGVSIYDGDTPEALRRKIAINPPPLIVSNPDMLHVGLIYSPYVRKFVETAEVFVFDELHVYEGTLGAHLHHLVHRVKLTRSEKAQFIASSATIGNPREFAECIFEEEFKEVRGSLARRGKVVHLLVSAGYMSRWSVVFSIAKFLADNNLRFIAFVDSQQLAEVVASVLDSRYGVNVAVHRAGLPYEVRKEVENKLREGELQGVVATPTLELGIDIGSLDAVLMAAPPPSYAKYLQRAGRAGRRKKGYVITILSDDPIDSYYVRNPAKFFDQELPPSVVEPFNEEVSKLHFVAYLLQVGRVHASKVPREWRLVLGDLVTEHVVRRLGSYVVAIYSVGHKYVSERGGIRSHGEVVEIVDINGSQPLASRELPLAVLELYPGAVYFYMKRPYEVVRLDLGSKRAFVRETPVSTQMYTRPLYVVDVVDYNVLEESVCKQSMKAAYAKVLLELRVYGYVVKDLYSGEVRALKVLEEPITYSYSTRAVLLKLPTTQDLSEYDHAEAFHAIEHALISASRIVCGAGLTDLGGISYPSGDIVVYDSAIGGSGVSKLLYVKLEKAINTAYELIAGCTCEDGCPRCIYSPYCGNNNKVLSRKKALYVLGEILSRRLAAETPPLEERSGKPLV